MLQRNTRIPIVPSSVEVVRDVQVCRYIGHDGWPAAASFDVVVCEAGDGRRFWLPNCRQAGRPGDGAVPAPRYDAPAMADRVCAAGSINPKHCSEGEPDSRTLEEQWTGGTQQEALDARAWPIA